MWYRPVMPTDLPMDRCIKALQVKPAVGNAKTVALNPSHDGVRFAADVGSGGQLGGSLLFTDVRRHASTRDGRDWPDNHLRSGRVRRPSPDPERERLDRPARQRGERR